MADIVLLYITCANRDEALSLAHALVGERLVACANITDNVTSIYRWQGEIERSTESILIAKTQADKIEAATALVKKLHSYTTPCVVALPVLNGNPDFLSWIRTETTAK